MEASRASLRSCLVPRCSWAAAQMQLEDEAAAKKSHAPCCSLCGRASLVHVCVFLCVLCVCKRERERRTETEKATEYE